MTTTKPQEKTNAPRTRSPNYPSLALEMAIDRVAKLKDFKSFPVAAETALQKMGYKPTSSTGLQALGALRAYGLVEAVGSGGTRQIRVTDRALKIIGGHSERANLIRDAALLPPIHKELWEKFRSPDGALAADEIIRQYLVFDRPESKFLEESVPGFLSTFKRTVAFANLDSSENTSVESGHDDVLADNGSVPAQATSIHPASDPRTAPLPRAPQTGWFPLPAVIGEGGAFEIVNIPRMSQEAFDRFKTMLDAFKDAIVINTKNGNPSDGEGASE